jgi:hypothetical protein
MSRRPTFERLASRPSAGVDAGVSGAVATVAYSGRLECPPPCASGGGKGAYAGAAQHTLEAEATAQRRGEHLARLAEGQGGGDDQRAALLPHHELGARGAADDLRKLLPSRLGVLRSLASRHVERIRRPRSRRRRRGDRQPRLAASDSPIRIAPPGRRSRSPRAPRSSRAGRSGRPQNRSPRAA